MSGKIDRRRRFGGTGMFNSPEFLEELDARRAQHARLIEGKPEKTFAEVLEQKMRGDDEEEPADEETPEERAIDPHMGLSPSQSPELAKGGKGRRAGRVIVKG